MFSLQSQRSLKESQGALLEKVEELTEQLKQERQRALALEGQLNTSTLSLQTLDKVLRLYTCIHNPLGQKEVEVCYLLLCQEVF